MFSQGCLLNSRLAWPLYQKRKVNGNLVATSPRPSNYTVFIVIVLHAQFHQSEGF